MVLFGTLLRIFWDKYSCSGQFWDICNIFHKNVNTEKIRTLNISKKYVRINKGIIKDILGIF